MQPNLKVFLVEMGSNLQGVYTYRPGNRAMLSINQELDGTDEFFEVLFKFYAVHFRLAQETQAIPHHAYYYRDQTAPQMIPARLPIAS